MTINDFYKNFQQQLQNIYSNNEAAVITEWVFETVASIKRFDILKLPDQQLNNETTCLPDRQVQQLNNCLHQLLQHKPVQYVLGEAWFYKMKLKVNEQVLIPRPETEELVQWILETTASKKINTLLDIGTGSGCIAITLQKTMVGLNSTAIDVSENALAIAKENAASQNVLINFIQLDFLDEAVWKQLPLFDTIVSNPPYIPLAEKDMLDKNVTAWEPHSALFVPDSSPLLFYQKIAAFGLTHLNEGGNIFAELHENYAAQTAAVFSKYYSTVEIKKDISGKERMLMAVR